jgi:riboflavin kinase/FMN adenylyltransferase
MKTFLGANIEPGALKAPKVTLGTFDGVHLGHQQVLRQLLGWARSKDSGAVVVTFDQKPRRVLDGGDAGPILSLEHRLLLFERLGLDAVVLLQFDAELASMEPEEFVREILLGRIGASGVLLGHDTHFGRGGRGDFELMIRLGEESGFEVCSVPVVELDGAPISSTRIRAAIREGNLALARRMLGRRVSIFGTVVHGTGRGKGFGWPTANLDLHHEVRPPEGVYVTQTWLEGRWRGSITNIGRPPTLSAKGPEHLSEEAVVETHMFDYRGDLYGRDLEVQFLDIVRPEQVFRSRDELTRRIEEDVRRARERLAKETS